MITFKVVKSVFIHLHCINFILFSNVVSIILAILNFTLHLICQHGTIFNLHIFIKSITSKCSDDVDDVMVLFMFNNVICVFT